MPQMLFGTAIVSGKYTPFPKASKSTCFTLIFAKTPITHKKYNVFTPAGRPASRLASQAASRPASQPAAASQPASQPTSQPASQIPLRVSPGRSLKNNTISFIKLSQIHYFLARSSLGPFWPPHGRAGPRPQGAAALAQTALRDHCQTS